VPSTMRDYLNFPRRNMRCWRRQRWSSVLTTEMRGLQGAFKKSIDIQFVFTLRLITEVPKSSLLKEQTSPQLRETQTLKACFELASYPVGKLTTFVFVNGFVSVESGGKVPNSVRRGCNRRHSRRIWLAPLGAAPGIPQHLHLRRLTLSRPLRRSERRPMCPCSRRHPFPACCGNVALRRSRSL
jgi:hypothetical protein